VLTPTVVFVSLIAREHRRVSHGDEFGDITVTAWFPADDKPGSLVVLVVRRVSATREPRPLRTADEPTHTSAIVAVLSTPVEYFTRTFNWFRAWSRYSDTDPLSRSASTGAVEGAPK